VHDSSTYAGFQNTVTGHTKAGMQQQNLIQTSDDKLKRRLSLTHQQRYENAMRMLKLQHAVRQAKKKNKENGHS
jgi:hypothetical protein